MIVVTPALLETIFTGKPKRGRGRPSGSKNRKPPKVREKLIRVDLRQKVDFGRDAEMIAMYKRGDVLETIGKHFGITRERVRQRLARHGITKKDGGWARRILKQTGMTLEAWRAHIAEYGSQRYGSPFARFTNQRNAARRDSAAWELTFAEWWAIWCESGKWSERGRGYGYGLVRYGGSGPFRADNVFVCDGAKRAKDSYLVTPASVRVEKARKTRAANGYVAKGWQLTSNKTKPYRAYYNHKKLGYFATAEEAHAAYLKARDEAIR